MAEQEQSGDGTSAGNETGGSQPDPQVESRAREMGWIPKAEFRGDQTKWIDAPDFVERAESLLPIVRSENRRLHTEVTSLRTQLAQSNQATQELRESVEDLKKFQTEAAKDRVKATRAEVARGIKQAREDGDVERELALQDELNEANEALREAETPPVKKPPATGTTTTTTTSQNGDQPTPEFLAWQQTNPWYGAQGQERKTNYALAVAQDLRRSQPQLVGKAFFDKVSEEVQAVFEPQQRRTSKVEGGNGSSRSGNGGDSGDKTFNHLPPEAQATARAQARRFVGPNKSFKTDQEWFSHYATLYFAQ